MKIILFLLGLSSLITIDILLTEGFHRDQVYREHVTAERLKAQVQSTLKEHVTALLALKVVYQNFTDINHYDFQQYGKSITDTFHGFQRLFFIDSSMTIRQVYPVTPENKGLYGYSLTRNPALAKALIDARSPANPTTTRLISFLSHPKTFWAFIPVYRNNHEFLGYAVGEISLERLWQPLTHSFSGYQTQLIDPISNRLYPQVNFQDNDPDIMSLRFDLVGKEHWTLRLKPMRSVSQSLLILRFALWMGGLLILFLASKIVSSSQRHKIQMDEAKQQFQTIVEASPDGILLLDSHLRLKISNAVVREWLGKTESELTGKSFFDLFECECPNLSKCNEFSRLLCTSKQFADELPDVLETKVIDPPGGLPKTFRLNASKITQIRDHGPPEEGFICILGDISTRKELERVKETYVATLTHDLKTPLLAQQMVLETLVGGSLGSINDEQRRLLSGAWESVQDLIDMVNSTLLFYKLESSHVTLHRQNKPIAPLIKDVMQTLQPLADKRGVHLELDAAPDLPEASMDVIQMKRVFHNLLTNAIHYSSKSSPIRASLRQDMEAGRESCVLIEFYNEGKGITESELPKIFDKYHSASKKFKQIGSGLGLYITRRIIELHGGKVWASSIPNQHTKFFISLPSVQSIQPTDPGGNRQTPPMSVV